MLRVENYRISKNNEFNFRWRRKYNPENYQIESTVKSVQSTFTSLDILRLNCATKVRQNKWYSKTGRERVSKTSKHLKQSRPIVSNLLDMLQARQAQALKHIYLSVYLYLPSSSFLSPSLPSGPQSDLRRLDNRGRIMHLIANQRSRRRCIYVYVRVYNMYIGRYRGPIDARVPQI